MQSFRSSFEQVWSKTETSYPEFSIAGQEQAWIENTFKISTTHELIHEAAQIQSSNDVLTKKHQIKVDKPPAINSEMDSIEKNSNRPVAKGLWKDIHILTSSIHMRNVALYKVLRPTFVYNQMRLESSTGSTIRSLQQSTYILGFQKLKKKQNTWLRVGPDEYVPNKLYGQEPFLEFQRRMNMAELLNMELAAPLQSCSDENFQLTNSVEFCESQNAIRQELRRIVEVHKLERIREIINEQPPPSGPREEEFENQRELMKVVLQQFQEIRV